MRLLLLPRLGLFFALALGVASTATSAPAHTQQVPAELKVLTYNMWGLPSPLSKDPEGRIEGFCSQLKTQDPQARYDVVMLQEVWRGWMAEALKHCGYAHSLRLDQSDYETGLMILSDHPLVEGRQKSFDNKPTGFLAWKTGEAIANKGVQVAVMVHPEMGRILLGNLHLVANYKGEVTFEDFREAQLHEARVFLGLQRQLQSGVPVIIGGDYNVSAEGPSYTPLWDRMLQLFAGYERFVPPQPVSTRSTTNPYSAEEEGQLDHLFASSELKAVRGAVVFDQAGSIFSDHYGWETTFVSASLSSE